MPNFSSAAITSALNAVFPTGITYYANLSFTDPSTTGLGEMGGGSNARVPVTWTASGGTLSNSAALDIVVGMVPSNLLGNAVQIGDQTITLTSATGTDFPQGASDFAIQIDSEIMLVTGGQGTTSLTVTRGYNGTTPTTHADGATITVLVSGIVIWSAATGGTYIGGTGIAAPSPFTFVPFEVAEGQTVTYAIGSVEVEVI